MSHVKSGWIHATGQIVPSLGAGSLGCHQFAFARNLVRVFRALSRHIIQLSLGFAAALLVPALANAALSVTPITWNVIGLDSNAPAAGPKYFPVGARACSTTATTNVNVNWVWDSTNANINLRSGSLSTLAFASIAAGSCVDAYFEIEVNQTVAAFDTTRRYHVVAVDGSGSASTPVPRELYVEHLISQNRNSIIGAKLNGVPIPAGGSIGLVLGNTYTIELDSGTATQGYNQFESFINFSNAIFQILSVTTSYSANNSPYVSGPAPATSDKLYADACLWQNDPASPNYRSCVGGDYKSGGNDIKTTYVVKIIGGGGTAQALTALLYDFSGSSYHYNADFSVNSWIATIINPAALTIAKSFSPNPTNAGGIATLTFTLTNPNAGAVSGVSFIDSFPTLPGAMVVAAAPNAATSGCGTPTFSPVAGAGSVSFSGGTLGANSTCTVKVNVTVPVTGTYNNTSGHLFAGAVDTGNFASASLVVNSAPPPGTGVCGITMARWNFPTGMSTTAPLPTIANVTASTAAGAGVNPVFSVQDNTIVPAGTGSWSSNGGLATGAALVTANNDYFEFALNTTGYTSVFLTFDARRTNNGPQGLAVFYGTTNTRPETGTSAFSNATALTSQSTWFSFGAGNTIAFTSGLNPSGTTYFRIYGFNAGNSVPGSDMFLDNVLFTGCGTAVQPTIGKSFSPNPIAVSAVSTLTFTLTNGNAVALTGAQFTDSLPAGVQVAATPAASTTCGGPPTWAPAAAATTLSFSGGTIPASGSCAVSVNVTATTAGPHGNVSGFVSTVESGTSTSSIATATLTAILPPSIAKQFSPSPVLANGTSLLTFSITNSNAGNALGGVAFGDTYPAGLTNANPLVPAVSNTCGGVVTAVAGGNSLSLAGGSIAVAGNCTITVPVTAAVTGTYVNTSGAVSDAVAGSGNTASGTLAVNAPNPSLGVSKKISTNPAGPWTKFVTVAPGTLLYYQFTAENTGDVALNPFSVTDPALAGTAADPVACVWQTINVPSTLPVLPVGTALIDPTATCVVGPIAAVLGAHSNTATAHGTFSGTSYDSAPSTADYIAGVPGFSLLKQISASAAGPWTSVIGAAAGSGVYYKFTIVNTGVLDLTSVGVTDPLVSTATCAFTDPLVAGSATTCVVGPVTATGVSGSTTTNTATAHGTNGSVFTTAPSSARYTIATTTADLAITKSDGVASVVPGTATTYTIVVTNNGPGEVTGATVVDSAPAGVTFGAWTCVVSNVGSGGTVTTACGTASGSANINTTVTMKSGGVITYTVPATIAAGATGTIDNTATVSVPTGVFDPTPGNNSATDTDTLTAQADLSITKTDGVASVVPGTATTYSIVVSNSGPSNVIGANVSDVLPAAVTSATWTCVGAGGGTCPASGVGNINSVVNLPVGATTTFTLIAQVSAAASGTLVNTATVTPPAGTTDPNPGNNSATDTDTITVVAPTADLGITKTDGSATYTAGGPITYVITVSNAGPASVTGASVVDALPAVITGAGWTCVGAAGGTCPASGSGNINVVVNLPVSASVTFTLTGTVASSATGNLVNTATVTPPAGTTDPNPGNNSATDTDSPSPIAGLAITKTDGSATYTPGGTGIYTITVTNSGPSNANSLSVTDNLPSGVTLTGTALCAATGTAACGTLAGTTGGTSFTAMGATLAAGAGNSLVFTLPVRFAVWMNSSPLVNTATASDPAAVAVVSASDSNVLANAPAPAPANDIPVDNQWALSLLAACILLLGWRQSNGFTARKRGRE